MKTYQQFLRLNEDLNPYVGFYKVNDLNKVIEDLTGRVEFDYNESNKLVTIEDNHPTAHHIVMENGGEVSYEWLKEESGYPSNGVLIRMKPFTIPKGAVM